jgi:hypothetical protein
LGTAAGEINCLSTDSLAHPDAQSAKNAIIIIQYESGFLDPELCRQIFDKVVVGAPSQEELNDHLPVVDDLLAIGLDLHARPNRIVTGSDKSCSPPVEELYRTDSAQAGRLKGFMVAEGGNVDVILLCNLKDCRPFFSLYFFAVEFEGYHVSFLARFVT